MFVCLILFLMNPRSMSSDVKIRVGIDFGFENGLVVCSADDLLRFVYFPVSLF